MGRLENILRQGNPLSLTRFAELALASRLGRSRFSLVFHVEGMVNPRIVRALGALGKEVKASFRPCAAVTTPLCPMYTVDPLVDPERTSITAGEPTDAMRSDFEGSLGVLSEYFDIGYHGHYFSHMAGGLAPSLNPSDVDPQFESENRLLSRLGHRPRYYAGGWWLMSGYVAHLLSSAGYEADTTVNETGRDAFGGAQQVRASELGRPFMLEKGVVEIPSFRSLKGLTRTARGRSLGVISLHDYDLVNRQGYLAIRKLLIALTKMENIVSLPELVAEAKSDLRAS